MSILEKVERICDKMRLNKHVDVDKCLKYLNRLIEIRDSPRTSDYEKNNIGIIIQKFEYYINQIPCDLLDLL